MDDAEFEKIPQIIRDCVVKVLYGDMSSDPSFYEDEERQAELNKRSDLFDAIKGWVTHLERLEGRSFSNNAHERGRDAVVLYNPFQGLHGACQVGESLDAFLSRLPPSTSVASAELPWIRMANPECSLWDIRESKESIASKREGFQDLGQMLLTHLEEEIARADIKKKGRSCQVQARAIKNLRSETVEQIQMHAIDLKLHGGKWMLFIPSSNVDHVWRIIAGATVSGDLGSCAKVAPWDKDNDPENRRARLICVYTKDFSDVDDVVRVLGKLKNLGIVGGSYKIYYKPDAYTYLDIKAGNPYCIRPWIYCSSDVIALQKERAEGKTVDK